ncbi:helix-turn-helix domain-containing protein [Aurantimonas sp. NFXS3]|uniref:helix-turn-helix domain-containing protein n=1 Tax=Aurantimonas sp. NFXS3 TaxID=2818434 RepID=UPI003B8BF36C
MGIAAHSTFTARGIAERQRLAGTQGRALRADPAPLTRAPATHLNLRYRLVYERQIERPFLPPAPYRPALRRILERVAKAYEVKPKEILGPSRDRKIALPRHAFFYWARRLTSKSLPQIGRFCGDRDHTTVLHGVRAYPGKRREMGRHVRDL